MDNLFSAATEKYWGHLSILKINDGDLPIKVIKENRVIFFPISRKFNLNKFAFLNELKKEVVTPI